jgi:hypothetical protein
MGDAAMTILQYSNSFGDDKTPESVEAVALLVRTWRYSHFPLTCEGSIRTFYAFSGVETAGEQEAQESCFPVRALTGSKLAAQSNF